MDMRGIMPPGHEHWDAFEKMILALPLRQQKSLRLLRDHLVFVVVARYVSLIAGLCAALACELVATLGLGFMIDPAVLVCAPIIAALVSLWLTRSLYIRPCYGGMCETIQRDPALLPLLRKAAADDYAIRPALQVVERRLAPYADHQ